MIEKEWDIEVADSRRDALHPIVADYAERRINHIRKKISGVKIDRCLELGAGDGFFSRVLNTHFDLTMVDSSEAMLAKNPVKKNQVIMDSTSLGFASNSFDVVFEANMLHHVKNMDQVLSEMHRVTRKYLVILEPNRNNPLTILLALSKEDERESLKFSKTFIESKMKDYNMELIESVNFGVIPANRCPMWFWKLMKKLDGVIPFFGLETILVYRKI